MEITFLGTGSAWSVPEHSCRCAICRKMTALGERRTRTSLLVRGIETILVDCGPDVNLQMRRSGMTRPDAVIITHEHGDHYLGMDDLLAFRRSVPKDAWAPIPVYATERSWQSIEPRFGYLLGSLIEKRTVVPGLPLQGIGTRIIPFKTFHGAFAAGSVGYVLEDDSIGDKTFRLVYTSDLIRVEEEIPELSEPDILIIQSHWLNEPRENRPNHMSFQRAMDYINAWRPRIASYLVHISDADQVPGDPCNNFLKKLAPLSPLSDPATGEPYPIPTCHEEWQKSVDRICSDYGAPGRVLVAYDGMMINHV
jgi:phosphoribosyl 1,2-cyclic phosphate phosphodiesterase